jgi:hypothetical protein
LGERGKILKGEEKKGKIKTKNEERKKEGGKTKRSGEYKCKIGNN